MADPSRLHARAIHSLVDNATPASMDVYFGRITKADADLTWPYLVVWPSPANRLRGSLNGNAGDWLTTTTQVTTAGRNVDEVLAALDRATAALHCVTPTIAGRVCGQISQQPGQQPPSPRPDPQARTADGQPVLFTFALFDLSSAAA